MVDPLRLYSDYLHIFRTGLMRAMWPETFEELVEGCRDESWEYAILELDADLNASVDDFTNEVPDRVLESVGRCDVPPIHVAVHCRFVESDEWNRAVEPVVKHLRASIITGLHQRTDIEPQVITMADQDLLDAYQWLAHTSDNSLVMLETVETFQEREMLEDWEVESNGLERMGEE